MDEDSYYQQLAQQVAAAANVPWQYVYAQWQHETGNFTSTMATQYNNFGGIKTVDSDPNQVTAPDGGQYKTFSSPQDFANYDAWYLQQYTGLAGSQTSSAYLNTLQSQGYFTDSMGNYASGFNSFLSQLTGLGVNQQIAAVVAPAASNISTGTGNNTPAVSGLSGLTSAITNLPATLIAGASRVGYVLVGMSVVSLGVFLMASNKTETINIKEGAK